MVHPEDAGQLVVAGVPVGDGVLPLTRRTKRLLDHSPQWIKFENVWAYTAPNCPSRVPLDGVALGEGAFAFADPPIDPAHLVLDQSRRSLEQLVNLKHKALLRGTAAFCKALTDLAVSLPMDGLARLFCVISLNSCLKEPRGAVT